MIEPELPVCVLCLLCMATGKAVDPHCDANVSSALEHWLCITAEEEERLHRGSSTLLCCVSHLWVAVHAGTQPGLAVSRLALRSKLVPVA